MAEAGAGAGAFGGGGRAGGSLRAAAAGCGAHGPLVGRGAWDEGRGARGEWGDTYLAVVLGGRGRGPHGASRRFLRQVLEQLVLLRLAREAEVRHLVLERHQELPPHDTLG